MSNIGPMESGARESRWWPVIAAVVVIAATLPSLPPGIRNWDNTVKVQLAWNLVHGDGLVLTQPTPSDDDYVMRGADGRAYTGYPPLAAVLHVPTVGVFQYSGVAIEGLPDVLLLGILAGVVFGWGRRAGAPKPAAMAGAMLACLGTALWPMAALGYDVIIEAVALASLLWVSAGEDRARSWAWAGFACGAALATRLGAIVLVAPAAAALALHRPRGLRPLLRRATAFGLGCSPGLIAIAWYNVYRFGSPFTAYSMTESLKSMALAVPWLSAHHWQGIAGLTVSPGKGALWYGPPLLLVLLTAGALLRRWPRACAVLGVYALAAAVGFGRLTFWHGEWGWGPRYISPIYVAVAPLAWLAWEKLASKAGLVRVGAAAAFFLAIAIQAIPIVVNPIGYHLAHTLRPLAAAGALETQHLGGPPVPEDNRVLYFRFENSMLVSAARALTEDIAESRAGTMEWLGVALLVPAAALGIVLGAARTGRARASVGPNE